MAETTPADTGTSPGATPELQFMCSRYFLQWMAEQKLSLVLSTYQVGKLFFLGTRQDGRLDIFNRTFERSMGLCVNADTLYMSSTYQLWRFDNMLDPEQDYGGYDRLYVPQIAWTTGDLDVHDIALDAQGQPVFVNTLFGCLATISDRYSFKPLWKPPFLSALVPEDRCHLNGLAMRDGKPAWVSAVARSDVADGWRDRRTGGGLVMDVNSREIVCDGLSMPHSPRWHQGKLWVLNSGEGQFGFIDIEAGKFEPVAFLPGYGRGLSFHGNYAIVGLSRPRDDNNTFAGLPLADELTQRDADARCGVMVIDITTGTTMHWVRIEGVIRELYDVCVLPGYLRPMAIGLKTDEIKRMLRVAPSDLD